MIKRKGSRLRRAAAVLLSAMLIVGLLSDTVPVNVLAKETAKPSVQTQEQEDGGTSVPKVSEEKQETGPAGEGSVTEPDKETGQEPETEPGGETGTKPDAEPETKPGQDMETDPAEDETEPGEGNITEPGQETEKEPGEETGSEDAEGTVPEEPDGGTEKEPDDETDQTEQETQGTDIEGEKESETVSGNDLGSETMARPQGVMRASKVSARAGEIASGTDWVLEADGKLTISSDMGMTFWREVFLSEEQAQLADQVQKVVIQDNVSSIGETAFVNCSNLTDIVIPESVTSIGGGAFGNCSSLSQITIPEKVTDIEDAAFMGCSSLTEITIPASVERIGNGAFIGCSKLQKITMRGETPPAIGNNDHAQSLFYECQFSKERQQGIHVPDGRADAYRNTPGWNVWAEFIADDKVPAEKHEHDGVTYTPWTKTDSLPTDAGNYYLTENVTLSYGRTVPEGTTSLCLNGKTIRLVCDEEMQIPVIEISENRILNLHDCAGNGQITGGRNGGIFNRGTFNMYGGKITGNSSVISSGVVNMAAFRMYGGEISQNTVTDEGGAAITLFMGSISSSITLGGNAVITGNTNPAGRQANVKIPNGLTIKIDSANPLSDSAQIGITTVEVPTEQTPVNITGANSEDYSRYFHSDNPDYAIADGPDHVVQLIVPHTHNLTLVPENAATCTELGNKAYYTCTGCDRWFLDEAGTQEIENKNSVVIAVTEHRYDDRAWDYRDADGHAHVCQDCGARDTVRTHTPGAAATEMTPQTCTECGYIMVPVLGHTCNPQLVGKTEPDCTTAGRQAYYHCEGCEKDYEDEAGTILIADINTWGNIPALGHDYGSWQVIQNATATTPGKQERTCKRCGDKATESIPATGEDNPGGDDKPGGGEDKPGGGDKPGGDDKPGGGDKPGGEDKPGSGGDNKPGGDDKPGGGDKPGGDDKPGGEDKPGAEDKPGGGEDRPGGEDKPASGDNKPGGEDKPGSGDNKPVGGNSTDAGNNIDGSFGSGNVDAGSDENPFVTDIAGDIGSPGSTVTGAPVTTMPGSTVTGQPRVKQEREGNIRKEVRVEGEGTLDVAVATPLSQLADILLTETEKQQAADGTDISFVLDVKDASAVADSADKVLVQTTVRSGAARDYTIGQYLDISLYKVVGGSHSAITQTNGKITITIAVPGSLKNTDGTKKRTFAVVRVHDGKAELLTDRDSNDDTITIETDLFSTYAIVYKDMAGGLNGSNPGGAKDNEPKTGDRTSLELSATLSMIAGLTYLVMYFADRRHGMTEETKKELVASIIGWAKQGGRVRRILAIAAIFLVLLYYHSIGKKAGAAWEEIYGA